MNPAQQERARIAQALGEEVKSFTRGVCAAAGLPDLADSVLVGALLSEILDDGRPESKTVQMLLVTAAVFADAAFARSGLGDAPIAGASPSVQ
jgi:hypothetical protein